jgi:hypothetical protein
MKIRKEISAGRKTLPRMNMKKLILTGLENGGCIITEEGTVLTTSTLIYNRRTLYILSLLFRMTTKFATMHGKMVQLLMTKSATGNGK